MPLVSRGGPRPLACPRSVGCSIYSARPELHDALTRLPGSLEKSLRSIRLLRDAGVPVIIKTALTRAAAPHWRELADLAHGMGCSLPFDLGITAQNDGRLAPLAQRVTDEVIVDEIFSSRYYDLSYSGEQAARMTRPHEFAGLCGAGAGSLAVGPTGEIRPCIALNVVLGSIRERRLGDIWGDSPFLREFEAIRAVDVEFRRECADFAMCSRCPGAWLAEGGSYLRPTEHACFLGHALARAQRRRLTS